MGINLNDKGYNDVPPANPGEYVKLPAGGYICRIVNAELIKSKAGNLMLVLSVDIADGDFQNFFKANSHNDKWNNSAIYRQLIFDSNNRVSSFLKGLFTCIENSNDNFKVNVRNFEPDTLRGKLCGFIFGDEEYERRDLSIGVKTVIKFPKTVDDIQNHNFKIPELKKLSAPPSTAPPDKDFPDSVPVDPDDIPF